MKSFKLLQGFVLLSFFISNHCYSHLLDKKSTFVLSINGNQQVPKYNEKIDYKELKLINKAFPKDLYEHKLLMDETNPSEFKKGTSGQVPLDENLNNYQQLGRDKYHEKVKSLVLESLKSARAKNQEVVLNFLGHGENKEVSSSNNIMEIGELGTKEYRIENACVGFASKFVQVEFKNFNQRYKGACITYSEFASLIQQAGYGRKDSPLIKIISSPCKGGGAAYITRKLDNTCGGWFADHETDYLYNSELGPKLFSDIEKRRSSLIPSAGVSLGEAINKQNTDMDFFANGGTSSADFIHYTLASKGINSPSYMQDFEKEFLSNYKKEISELELNAETENFCSKTSAQAPVDSKIGYWVKESILQNMLYSNFLPPELKKYYVEKIDEAIKTKSYNSRSYKKSIKLFLKHAEFYRRFHNKPDSESKRIMQKYQNLVNCERKPL
jgi:hypothetical protein